MPFIAPELIESERIVVRPVLEADLPSVLAVNGNAEVVKHLGHAPWQTMADAEAWFARISKQQAAGAALEFVIVEKQTGNVIGRCGLFEHDPGNAQASLGYILGRPYWRQGYMREALTCLINCAFNTLELRRLEARVEAPNTASSGLLLRLGFTKEGVLRERWVADGGTTDADVFGLLRQEWNSMKAPLDATQCRPGISVAIFVFPEVEVLDFAGPYEVFTTASRVSQLMNLSPSAPFNVFTVAQSEGSLRARAGLVVMPERTFANHPPVDLLIIPGGVVDAGLKTPAIIEWIKQTASTSKLTASVCNGALLLAQAGLLDGKRCTTHWSDMDELRAALPSATVLENQRWVDDGCIVTSGGISAGIDMCLHLVERLAGRELALATARRMEFLWRENTTP